MQNSDNGRIRPRNALFVKKETIRRRKSKYGRVYSLWPPRLHLNEIGIADYVMNLFT